MAALFDTSLDKQEFLPKEPVDLPREPLDLPKTTMDIPIPHENEHVYTQQPHDVKTLLEWKAPGRPFRRRGKEFYVSSLLIMVLVEIILFLFSQYLLMLVVISFVFEAFALVTVPPHDFKYRISTEGLTIEDHFFLWQELYDFYFKKQEGVEILHIRTQALLPGELTLTLGAVDKNQLKGILLQYLPYREIIKPTFMEKSADWLSKNFPLEKTAS